MKKIGIKLADGAFFPILKEGTPDKKKINLTTVKDNQTTVQVSLFASESSSMEDAILIDTLKINKLDRQPNGQPNINLTVSLDKKNFVEATLKDDDTKEQATISADLQAVLLASDKNPGTGKGLLGAAEEIKLKAESKDAKIASELDDFSFDIPAFEEGPAPKTEIVEEEPKAKKPAPVENEATVAEDTNFADVSFEEPPVDDVPVDETALDMPDFDVPDFASQDDGAQDSADKSDELKFDDNEFDLPNFGEEDNSSSEKESAGASSSSSLDFSDLYDEDESESEEKKTRLPVLICLVCAIICVLAVLLLFFVIPSKFNLINSRSSEKTEYVQEQAAPVPPPVQKEEPLPPPPPAPPAKEEEIVVIQEAETVVPDLPKIEEKREPKVITYKIKWGDTLWDISAAYYKNPWRYKKIARYNGIKNPNHIVAGTYIKIPEE